MFASEQIAGLCNGSTPDSDSVCEGSNPSPAAKCKENRSAAWLSGFPFVMRLCARFCRLIFYTFLQLLRRSKTFLVSKMLTKMLTKKAGCCPLSSFPVRSTCITACIQEWKLAKSFPLFPSDEKRPFFFGKSFIQKKFTNSRLLLAIRSFQTFARPFCSPQVIYITSMIISLYRELFTFSTGFSTARAIAASLHFGHVFAYHSFFASLLLSYAKASKGNIIKLYASMLTRTRSFRFHKTKICKF